MRLFSSEHLLITSQLRCWGTFWDGCKLYKSPAWVTPINLCISSTTHCFSCLFCTWFSNQPAQPVPIETKQHITTESQLLGLFELSSALYSTSRKAMLIAGTGDSHSALTASRKWDSAVSAPMCGTWSAW